MVLPEDEQVQKSSAVFPFSSQRAEDVPPLLLQRVLHPRVDAWAAVSPHLVGCVDLAYRSQTSILGYLVLSQNSYNGL